MIRKIEKKDIKEIILLIESLYPNENSNKFIYQELKESFLSHSHKPEFFVVEHHSKIVGIGGFSKSRINYRIYEIFSLMIDLKFQNKGYGTSIMKRMIKEIKNQRREKNNEITIVLTSLKPEFFKKFGFETISTLKPNKSSFMKLVI